MEAGLMEIVRSIKLIEVGFMTLISAYIYRELFILEKSPGRNVWGEMSGDPHGHTHVHTCTFTHSHA